MKAVFRLLMIIIVIHAIVISTFLVSRFMGLDQNEVLRFLMNFVSANAIQISVSGYIAFILFKKRKSLKLIKKNLVL